MSNPDSTTAGHTANDSPVCLGIRTEHIDDYPSSISSGVKVTDMPMLISATIPEPWLMQIILKNQPWSRPDDEEPESNVEWNMWQRRLFPWDDLEVGRDVILVSGGGPSAAMLTYRVEVTSVVRAAYRSHADAWRRFKALDEREFPDGFGRQWFMSSDYTATKPTSGWLLAWTYRVVDQLMLPRPAEALMGRHGWGHIDAAELGRRSHAIPAQRDATKASGQGYAPDAELRERIENHAMAATRGWLRETGSAEGDIYDTSTTKPYDFEVRSGSTPMFRVEVKGSRGPLGDVFVTANEVAHARDGRIRTILAIVHDIELDIDEEGVVQPSGGTLSTIDQWRPEDAELTPVQYRYDASMAKPQPIPDASLLDRD